MRVRRDQVKERGWLAAKSSGSQCSVVAEGIKGAEIARSRPDGGIAAAAVGRNNAAQKPGD